MLKKRIIARLDIKAPNLIMPIRMEGLRKVGDPQTFAERYDNQGGDEIIYVDTVSSLYGRSNILDLVRKTSERAFCPLTVAGGARSVEDALSLLRTGADKIAINTAATKYPSLLSDLASRLGAQAVVLQVDVKCIEGRWGVMVDGGREDSGRDAVEWVTQAVEYGAGEILLTSIDRQGSGIGMDIDLIRAVSDAVSVPVVASGGVSHADYAAAGFEAGADGVAVASALHKDFTTLAEIRQTLRDSGIPVRNAA